MSLDALKKSRALWLARERYRHAKWKWYKTRSKRPEAELLALRKKWWGLYAEAHALRLRRDKQIAEAGYHIGAAGVALIKEFEGFPYEGRPYRDAVGVWTIGYGHTEGVGPNSARLTEPQAAKLLADDLDKKYAPFVVKYLKKYDYHPNQNQFDALVSFCYNLGPGYFERGRTMGDALASKDKQRIADAFLPYDKAGGRALPGLTRRRKAERALFLK